MAHSKDLTVGILLSYKESVDVMKKVGQYARFLEYYIKPYSESFKKVYVFGWAQEEHQFPFDNVVFVPNRRGINSYLYNYLMPFVEADKLRECQVLRLMQLTPAIPGMISQLLFRNKLYCNYGFVYARNLAVQNKKLKRLIWLVLEKVAFWRMDMIAAAHTGIVEYLQEKKVPEKKIRIIENGVDVDWFKPVLREGDAESQKLNLLFVGRFEVEKNLFSLTEALNRSKYKDRFKLTLVGSGSEETQLVELFQKYKIEYEIVKNIPHKELVSYYQAADIFLLVSLTEGYPKVLIEAMACGLPSIVSRYKFHKILAHDNVNCLTCEIEAESICEKLDTMVGDKELRTRLGKAAREWVETKNNIRTIIQSEIGLITSLVK
ncbi:glycosyltransferase family 4 protein [Candidatus Falkowbacteria bacterium]|nr:glycosyltransferase family 4 protein [Candidatus Falkowbacteria bacterium]